MKGLFISVCQMFKNVMNCFTYLFQEKKRKRKRGVLSMYNKCLINIQIINIKKIHID